MAYFNELPNVEVVSRFPDQSSNQDYTTIKNLWKRAKLREDIANAITAFNYYQIKEGERPDQIAERIYGDPELDWVILITNNITNFNEEWPLDNNVFYKYLIDKYGTEEALQEIHHTETVEQRDPSNRLVIPGGLIVDDRIQSPEEFTTGDDPNYVIGQFIAPDDSSIVTINLIQSLTVTRSGDNISNLIPDINYETSILKIYTRDGETIDINIDNDIQNTWPSGWGGNLLVYCRNQNINIPIDDVLDDTFSIVIPNRLYEVVGELIDGEIVPVFRFNYTPPG